MPDPTYSQQLTEAYRKAATGAAWSGGSSASAAWSGGTAGTTDRVLGGLNAPNHNATNPQSDGKAFIDPGISNNHSAPF